MLKEHDFWTEIMVVLSVGIPRKMIFFMMSLCSDWLMWRKEMGFVSFHPHWLLYLCEGRRWALFHFILIYPHSLLYAQAARPCWDLSADRQFFGRYCTKRFLAVRYFAKRHFAGCKKILYFFFKYLQVVCILDIFHIFFLITIYTLQTNLSRKLK